MESTTRTPESRYSAKGGTAILQYWCSLEGWLCSIRIQAVSLQGAVLRFSDERSPAIQDKILDVFVRTEGSLVRKITVDRVARFILDESEVLPTEFARMGS